MFKTQKAEYATEFKELAVKQVKDAPGIVAVTKDLGLIEQTLRNFIRTFLEIERFQAIVFTQFFAVLRLQTAAH